MITSFRHVGIVTKDMDKALNFYCEVLGCKIVVELIEDGEYTSNLIQLKDCREKIAKVAAPDGTVLELIQFMTNETLSTQNDKFNMHGFNHICFNVTEIDKLYQNLENKGVKFFSPPLTSPYDPVKTMFCHDPDGSIVQFVEVLDKENIRKGLE